MFKRSHKDKDKDKHKDKDSPSHRHPHPANKDIKRFSWVIYIEIANNDVLFSRS